MCIRDSAVTLLELQPRILPNDDEDASAVVEAALARDGVRVLCGVSQMAAAVSPGGRRLTIESERRLLEVEVDDILVGAGRIPNVEDLGLDEAGVAFGRAGVEVNDRLQTSNPRIYAAGDICSSYKFTHAADALARIVIQNALFFGRRRASALTIPWCTYTDPEVAHVGLGPKEADARGISIETFTIPIAQTDRARLDGETEGFLKIHTRKGRDSIVGATLVARHAGEMISEITLAMAAGAGLKTLAATVHPYPTQAEVIRKAGDAWNRTRLTPAVKRVFDALMRWRR
jgi:pyruvate/2-oxoglutarate dehydrogenase complex dihydrolipoamide dehydrogenase (E3) component